jgi:hypothetical protein
LPVHIISPREDLIYGSGVLQFIFKFNIHFIANGYRVGRRDTIDLKDPFHTGIICSTKMIFDGIPASCGFVNECFHKTEPDYCDLKPTGELAGFGGKIATN